MDAFDRVLLTTPRLRLRPLVAGDAEVLFAMFSDPLVMRYLSTPPWPSIDTAHALIERDLRAMAAGEYLRLGLERLDDGVLIGNCSVFNRAIESRRAELGYTLARPAWGRGYMHEALSAVVDFAFAAMQLNRLEADIDPRNLASARSLVRLGFRAEGLLRERWIVAGEVSDTALYGLLQSDWAARGCGLRDRG